MRALPSRPRVTVTNVIINLPDDEPDGAEQRALAVTEYFEQFRIFRDYIEHEDDLINQRATWNVTIQGFLFAAFALIVQSRVQATEIDHTASMLMQLTAYGLIPVVGFFVGFFSFLSTFAARSAIERLQQDYDVHVLGAWSRVNWDSCEQRRLRIRPVLPKITGGGAKKAAILGFALPHCIPLVFVFAWPIAVGIAASNRLLDPPPTKTQPAQRTQVPASAPAASKGIPIAPPNNAAPAK